MKKTAPQNNKNRDEEVSFVFGKLNYILLIAGIVVLALGYILLTGGGSDDPDVFNPEMFDKRRLVVAPILIVVGLLTEIVAIMYNPDKKDNE